MTFIKLQKERLTCLYYYLIAMIIRPFIRIKKNRIFFWSYYFDKFACNPKALTEYILDKHPEDFEIYWAFEKKFDISCLDKRIHVVRYRTLKYFFALYSSRFVFTNLRNARYDTGFVKKANQKYIMLWHGSFPLKKIEKDAEIQLGPVYVRRAKDDSRMCDLMLADSNWIASLIKRSFWYDGDILYSGLPRNDVFYNKQKISEVYSDIRKQYGLTEETKLVLYAPTFRDDGLLHYYDLNWSRIILCLEETLNAKVSVFVRLHPNMSKINGIEALINDSRVINVTNAPDITDFLLAADIMISDYTSAMFDFCRLGRPCFMYAIDADTYNRGFYWTLADLPFSLANNEDELIENIRDFNYDSYNRNVSEFIKESWGLFENGHACQIIYNWMISIK